MLARQAPAFAYSSLEGSKEQNVDSHADDNDEHHHCHNLRGIIEVAPILQEVAQREREKEQLSGHQGSPGKGPALLQTIKNGRESCRQNDLRIESHTM